MRMVELDEDKIRWYQDKIKGGFAEAIAATHFSAMGYFVQESGVEKNMPYYAKYKYTLSKNSNAKKHNTKEKDAKEFKTNIHNLVDVFPDLFIFSKEKNVVFTVEAKFRNGDHINFYDLEKELLWEYRHLLFTYEFIDDIIKKTISTDAYYSNQKYVDLKDSHKRDFDRFIKELHKSLKKDGTIMSKYINIPIFFYLVVLPKIWYPNKTRKEKGDDKKFYVFIYNPYRLEWKDPMYIAKSMKDFENAIKEDKREGEEDVEINYGIWFDGFKEVYTNIIEPTIEHLVNVKLWK